MPPRRYRNRNRRGPFETRVYSSACQTGRCIDCPWNDVNAGGTCKCHHHGIGGRGTK